MINLFDYERAAQERLTTMAYDYFRGGANDMVTLTDNRTAFERLRLRPRMMRDISSRSTALRLLGIDLPAPLLVAPMGFMGLAHEEGELAMVRGAGSLGLGAVVSTMSNHTMEEIVAEATGPTWFQLYVYKDRGVTRRLVERAEAAGYKALVLTVDTPVLGRRELDIRNGFHLPAGLTAANFTDEMGRIDDTDGDSGLNAYIASLWDTSLTWADVEWLRSITRLPVLVKGVLRGDDAAIAIERGASGIIVSNHGGRQLDTAPATIEALPDVVAGVAGRGAVIMDGGVRRGTDVVKAVGLGADAVLVGRPVMWGLSVNGEDGVKDVLQLLWDEFDLAMGLCGCTTLDEIREADLVR